MWVWLIFFTWYIFVIFMVKFQNPFSIDILFVILVAYLKASPLSLVPLVICVMSLMCLKFIDIQWDKIELCAMLLSNNLICIFMTSFLDTFTNHFVCTCFFVDAYLQRFVYLETYTYERCPFYLVSYFFESPWSLSLILWWFRKENILWVLVLSLFASLRTHVLLKIFDFMVTMLIFIGHRCSY